MVGDVIRANNVLGTAKTCVSVGHKLKCLHLDKDLRLEVSLTDKPNTVFGCSGTPSLYRLAWPPVHDATFMGQPNEASQQAYAI